jgi:hypothetical protein
MSVYRGDLSPVSCQLSPVTGHRSLVSCLLSPVSCHLSPVTCLMSPASCLLSVRCFLFPASCHLSPFSCLLSPVTCLLSPVSCLRVCYLHNTPEWPFAPDSLPRCKISCWNVQRGQDTADDGRATAVAQCPAQGPLTKHSVLARNL